MTGGWAWVGERALLARFDTSDPGAASRSAFALREELARRSFPEVEDLVPGADSLLVVLSPGATPSAALLAAETLDVPMESKPAVRHEIPVQYGGDAGPDLAELARVHGLSEPEVVTLHSEPIYRVAFVGFSPGFPYLIGLPDRLATPRLATPRARVPAGSVAIGGAYTGIYPHPTPGGWWLIGLTDEVLFDPHRDPPARLAPGAEVRFVPA